MGARLRSSFYCLLLAASLASLVPTTAWAQQIFGVWQTRVPGITFPMVITITLGPNMRFEQRINGGPSVCMQQMTVGEYGPIGPGVFRFVVRDYEPKRDCTGNVIRSMPGWTAALQLASPGVLYWRDALTGRTLQFGRLR